MIVMRDWLVEFNNGKIFQVRALSMPEAIKQAIKNLTHATRVAKVHEIAY